MRRRINEILGILRKPEQLQNMHPAMMMAFQVEATLMQTAVLLDHLGVPDEDEEDKEREPLHLAGTMDPPH